MRPALNETSLKADLYFFFCDATARCDGLRRICDIANTSQDVANLRKTHFAKVEIFQLFAKRRDAMRHKAVSPWRTQDDVFLDTVQKSCRSIQTRSCTTFLSGQNPHKCTPYCVTKRTSPFCRKKLPNTFLSQERVAWQLFKYKSSGCFRNSLRAVASRCHIAKNII